MYIKDFIKLNDKYNIKFINVFFFGCFFQWRRFNFFDKEIFKDIESDQVYDKLKVCVFFKVICIYVIFRLEVFGVLLYKI